MAENSYGSIDKVFIAMVVIAVILSGAYLVWGSPSSTGSVRSFQRLFIFGGTIIPENAAFSSVNRVSPFGDDSTISNCDNNVLASGWIDVLDHEAPSDPFNGIFSSLKDTKADINSFWFTYSIDGKPVDVTVTPIIKFENVLGSNLNCNSIFSDLGLTRIGDDGCWGRSFTTPLKLSPGAHQLETQITYTPANLVVADINKTINVGACAK